MLIADQPKEEPVASNREPSETDSILLPERSAGEWTIAAILFALSLLYLWPFRDYTALNADEGIVLQGAQRVLSGQVPYRDFFSFITPGSFFGMAVLFKVFGNSILVGRTVLLIYGGLFSVVTYLLARRVCSRWQAIFAAYLLLVTCLPYRFVILHNWDSTMWAYLALYCTVGLLQRPHWLWSFGAGTFAAFTVLCEQSKGAGIVVGIGVGLIIIWRSQPEGNFWTRWSLASMLGGFALPFVLTAAYFASRHCLTTMLEDWFWPLRHYSAVNRLPYGYQTISPEDWEGLFINASWGQRLFYLLLTSPCFLVPVLPTLALGILVFHSRRLWRKKPPGMASRYYIILSAAVVGLVLSTLATGRPDLTHIMYIAPPLFVVLAWTVSGHVTRSTVLDTLKPVLQIYLLIFFTGFGMLLFWGPRNAHLRLSTRRGTLKACFSDSVLPYIQANVTVGDKILIYPYQPLYYYLSGTFSPTVFEYLQPGLHTSKQIQDAISQLAADQTRLVLFELTFGGDKIQQVWPSTPPEVLARDQMADFIFGHYRSCAVLTSGSWRFISMVRIGLKCPGYVAKRNHSR